MMRLATPKTQKKKCPAAPRTAAATTTTATASSSVFHPHVTSYDFLVLPFYHSTYVSCNY